MKENISFLLYGSATAPKNWNGYFKTAKRNRLYYIHSGSGGYEQAGKTFPFEAGKLYLIPQNAKINVCSDADDPIMHSYCDFDIFPPIISPCPLCISADSSRILRAAADVFVCGCMLSSGKGGKQTECKIDASEEALLRSSIVFLIEKILNSSLGVILTDTQLLSVIEYMHLNMDKKISIENLAENAFMTTGGFIKKFKKHLGVTPHQYLQNLRLSTAEYLRKIGEPLEKISAAVGYSDAVALSHALHRKNSRKTANTEALPSG